MHRRKVERDAFKCMQQKTTAPEFSPFLEVPEGFSLPQELKSSTLFLISKVWMIWSQKGRQCQTCAHTQARPSSTDPGPCSVWHVCYVSKRPYGKQNSASAMAGENKNTHEGRFSARQLSRPVCTLLKSTFFSFLNSL